MNEFENQEVVEQVENDTQVENPQVQEEVQNTFEQVVEEEVVKTEEASETETVFEEQSAESETEETQEPVSEEPSEFEVLQTKFNALQDSYNQLQNDYEAAQTRITELEQFQASVNTEIEALRSKNEELQTSLQSYENQAAEEEENRKIALVEKYEKVMKEEEISEIKDKANDFSYDELESKLAIAFANKQMAGNDVKKVPLPEPQESQFALLMKKYRKN